MSLSCDACGTTEAHRLKYYSDGSRCCDRCGEVPIASFPDVYFDGKPEENLADDPMTGKPRVFSSRGEKAAYLKERGIVEAGDLVNGAPVFVSRDRPVMRDGREEVKLALKKIREMGQDVRRQAYLKIIKEQGGRTHA